MSKGNRNRMGGQKSEKEQAADKKARGNKENKENNQSQAASFQAIQNGLRIGIQDTLGEDKKRALEKTLEAVIAIQQKADKIKRDLAKNPEEALANFEDPFEDLWKIKDKPIATKIVAILLKDKAIKKYLGLQFSVKAVGLRADKLNEIVANTKEADLKNKINDFLIGIEDLKNPDGKYREENLRELNEIAMEIRNKIRNQINLEAIFASQPNLKQNLADEIYARGWRNSEMEYIDEDGLEEIEEVDVKYPVLVKFYTDHLTKDKIHNEIILSGTECGLLKKELDSFCNDQDLNDFPNIKIFAEMLNDPKIVPIPTEEVPVKPEENTGEEKKNEKKKEEKKEKDTSGFIYGAMASAGMWGMDLGFKTLMTMVFSPVSAAIWASQERMKLGKGGDAKFDTKGWQDIFPGSALDPEKDKKK